MSKPLRKQVARKSLLDKYQALKDIETGLSKKEVARKHDVPLSTLSTWFKNKEKIINAVTQGKGRKTKNVKGGRNDELDQAVYKYFLNLRSQNIAVSGPILKEKAMAYARQLNISDFKGSDGWLDRWKARHNITFKTVAGEAKSCTPEMKHHGNKPPCRPSCPTTACRTYTTQTSLDYFIRPFPRSRSTLNPRDVWAVSTVRFV